MKQITLAQLIKEEPKRVIVVGLTDLNIKAIDAIWDHPEFMQCVVVEPDRLRYEENILHLMNKTNSAHKLSYTDIQSLMYDIPMDAAIVVEDIEHELTCPVYKIKAPVKKTAAGRPRKAKEEVKAAPKKTTKKAKKED